MISKEIKRVRCDDVLRAFMASSKGCAYLTFTTPDVVDIYEIRKRWRVIRHFLCEKYRGVKYVMNFELHPKGHGWHIHSVWNRFIPLKEVLPKFRAEGFGRVDIQRIWSKGVSDYLTKHALKAYRGVSSAEIRRNPSFRLRLVNASRGLPVLSDYAWRSELKDDVRSRFDKYRRGHDVKSFRALYSALEVCALLRLSSVSELYSMIRRLRREWKMEKKSQMAIVFSPVAL